MARIRTIKPSLWASQKLGALSVLARLNFVGLISLADDEGRGRGEKRFLIGQLHPYAEHISEPDFVKSIEELEVEKLVAFYTVERARYYALPGWRSHQKIDHPQRSEIPGVPADHPIAGLFASDSRTPREPLASGSLRNGTEGNGMEGNGKQPRPDGSVDLSKIIGNGPISKLTTDEVALLDLRYPIRGEHHNKKIIDLDAEYCRWALSNLTKAGPQLTAALRARIKLKEAEQFRPGRKS